MAKIKLGKNYNFDIEDFFESDIVKSGNGAVAKARKKWIGKKCLIIIKPYEESR